MKLLPESLNLHVQGYVSGQDAQRQTRTAQEILCRFDKQPGLILGDEVGMGKTFVALAVAAAHAVSDTSRPVVVMVPSNVLSKWKRDASTFVEACLGRDDERAKFRVKVAETGVGLLKLLDDPTGSRATVILLSHGALNRKMADKWVKLATLQASVKGRPGAEVMRRRIARFAGMLLNQDREPDRDFDLYLSLLQAPVADWRAILTQAGKGPADQDDPVPEMFANALGQIDLRPLFDTLVAQLPVNTSANIKGRIRETRSALGQGEKTQAKGQRGLIEGVWDLALQRGDFSFPLLILDEAHRARHAGTQLATLLSARKKEADDIDAAGGRLAHRFDRMLFLTATPFQLGHAELINVLRRFEAIKWADRRSPAIKRDDFLGQIESLLSALNHMQGKTELLEKSWKRLRQADIDWAQSLLGEQWWLQAGDVRVEHQHIRALGYAFASAEVAVRAAEAQLKPWVLRHHRSPQLPAPHANQQRRIRIEGAGVCAETSGEGSTGHQPRVGGLRVKGTGALPFLLSARLATLPNVAKVFNEGLASSYEAMLDTRRDDDVAQDDERSDPPSAPPVIASSPGEKRAAWYVNQLRQAALHSGATSLDAHPKMKATVELAMAIWARGEKVLIFAHYRKTGQALRAHISEAMHQAVLCMGAKIFNCGPAEVADQIERMQERLDRSGAEHVAAIVRPMIQRFPNLHSDELAGRITTVVLRFMRTDTFLVRFGSTTAGTDVAQWMGDMFKRQDASGMALRDLVDQFLQALNRMKGEGNRSKVLEALDSIQTGMQSASVHDSDEHAAGVQTRYRRAANVGRVHGGTAPDTKERRVLAFNTPFYPEILIASSVLGEGVDLHQNCRHIIHHDLDWNPSALEQRTGRVDRLGSKAERCGHPIRVYLPYIEGCQDEKLFRVVMDRERWFGVVMGADDSMGRVLRAEPWEIEKMAEALLVPEPLIQALSMRGLDVIGEGADVSAA